MLLSEPFAYILSITSHWDNSTMATLRSTQRFNMLAVGGGGSANGKSNTGSESSDNNGNADEDTDDDGLSEDDGVGDDYASDSDDDDDDDDGSGARGHGGNSPTVEIPRPSRSAFPPGIYESDSYIHIRLTYFLSGPSKPGYRYLRCHISSPPDSLSDVDSVCQ